MYNYKIKFIVILMLFGIVLHSQIIDLRIGPGLRFHNNNINLNNPPSDPEVPSIGVFYNDGGVLLADFRFYFVNHHIIKKSSFLGISYSFEKIHSKNKDYALLLGDNLSIRNLNLYFGFGSFAFPKNPNSFIFGYMGLSFNNYRSETKLGNSYKAKYHFKNTNALRFAIGQDFYLTPKHNLFVNILLSYDIGSVERDFIDVYNGSEYVGKMEPVGDKILPDKVFSIIINIGYSLGI